MAFSPNVSGVTSCGVPGIRPVIYGSHLCHFYPDRDELVQSLVPFFQAGLLNNERCLWVTAEPLPAAQARAELEKITPDLEVRIANGQLRIVDGREVNRRALRKALKDGLRVRTGSGSDRIKETV